MFVLSNWEFRDESDEKDSDLSEVYYFDMIQVIMFYVMVESLYFSSLILHANHIIVRIWRIRKNLSLLLIIFSISTCNCNSVTLTLEHLSRISLQISNWWIISTSINLISFHINFCNALHTVEISLYSTNYSRVKATFFSVGDNH